MNRIYKVIYSKVRECYVVVSELAKNQGKKARSEHTMRENNRSYRLAAIVALTISTGSLLYPMQAEAGVDLSVNDYFTAYDKNYFDQDGKKSDDWTAVKSSNTDQDEANVGAKGTGAIAAGLFAQAGQQTVTIKYGTIAIGANALQQQKTDLTNDLSVNAGWGINVADKKDPDTGKVTEKNVISLNRNLGTNYADKAHNGDEKVTVAANDTGLVLGGYAEDEKGNKNNPAVTYGATGDDSVIVGGKNSLASGKGSVVTGGVENIASSDQSTVVGGSNNKAAGKGSSVYGGLGNTAKGVNSSVYGGSSNTAEGEDSSILGGYNNQTTAGYNNEYATVGGGEYNKVIAHGASVWGGEYNTAEGWDASVYGGYANYASGLTGTVLGGHGNYTYGQSATAVGGHGNSALGGESTSIGGKYNSTTGAYATALGGRSGLVSGEYSVGILGGSTGKNAGYTLAAGYRSVVTDTGITSSSMTEEQYNEYEKKVSSDKPVSGVVVGDSKTGRSLLDKFATAVGYQATADEAQTISFGHDAGDVSGYKITWKDGKTKGQYSIGSVGGDEQFVYGNEQPTIEEIHYDTAYYNRLVKVADGIDDHDVVVMEQLKQYAEKDASNLGNNIKVYKTDENGNVQLGEDKKPVEDKDATTNAQNKNKNAWGKAIGTGKIEANNGQLVTGNTVYDEVRPKEDGNYVKTNQTTGANLSALDSKIGSMDKDGNYIKKDVSVSSNLNTLDTQVKANADAISKEKQDREAAITNITNNIGDLSDSAVKYDADTNKTKITLAGKDGTTITNVKDGALSDSSTDAVNGKQLYAEQQAREKADAEINQKVTNNTNEINKIKNGSFTDVSKTAIHNIAKDAVKVVDGKNTAVTKVDGTDTTPTTYAVNVEGTGKVASGDTGLIFGGTLYNEVHVKTDGSYIKSNNTVGQNLSALDSGLKTTSDLIHTNDKGDIIQIGADSKATKVDISGKDAKGNKTGRVITGVVSDANDPNSAANVGYVNGITSASNEQIYRDMNMQYNHVENDISRAAAGSNALAALHPMQEFDPDDKAQFALGYGHYRNSNAGAVGAFYQPDENSLFSFGVSFGNGDAGLNAGVTVKFGPGGSDHHALTKTQMAKVIDTQSQEIRSQAKQIEALRQENAEMKAQIAAILAKLDK